ncbi:hypothetical protein ACLB2K_045643 [Fragaria x ananassa]
MGNNMGCGCSDGDDVIKTTTAAEGPNNNKPKEREEGEAREGVDDLPKVQAGPDKSIDTLLSAIEEMRAHASNDQPKQEKPKNEASGGHDR